MAAAVEIRTFWGALLSVLLKCIAALGFSTPASRAAAGRVEARTEASGQGRAQAQAAGRSDEVPLGARSVPRIPAPRGYEPMRRHRARTLPPTMKQRICAEAHGSSPSARSVRAGDLAEDISAAVALAQAAASQHTNPDASPIASPTAHAAGGVTTRANAAAASLGPAPAPRNASVDR
ncbi:DUF6344 domain-containing protein [Streptomyces polygonati]|uniref:DUF6344 domain-containing protein n=1 Tax=Streptomyces polygonati TaxID=1617087 RepID=A0ABV8HQZ0_9ACTN